MSRGLRFGTAGTAVLLTFVFLGTGDLRAADANVPRFLTGRQTSPAIRCIPRTLVGHRKRRLENRHPRLGLVVSHRLERSHLSDDLHQHRAGPQAPKGSLPRRRRRDQVSAREERPHLENALPRPGDRQDRVGAELAPRAFPPSRTTSRTRSPPKRRRPTASGCTCLFGNLGLFCYSLDGRPLWTVPIPARDTRYGWGTSMSPVVYGDRVYYADDNEEKSSLVALDKRTGKEIWRVSPPREDELFHSLHLGEPRIAPSWSSRASTG